MATNQNGCCQKRKCVLRIAGAVALAVVAVFAPGDHAGVQQDPAKFALEAAANGKDTTGRAGARIRREVLWALGFRVLRRKANKKRKRMVWAERLRQIGTEQELQLLRYKLSQRLFKRVCDAIRPWVEAKDEKQAKRSIGGIISAELRLSMALRYLVGGHYLDIADLHGVSKQTVHKSVKLVVKAIGRCFGNELQLPIDDEAALENIAQDYCTEFGDVLPGCIGDVDGIVIPIEEPRWGEVENKNAMRNRKACFAMVF